MTDYKCNRTADDVVQLAVEYSLYLAELPTVFMVVWDPITPPVVKGKVRIEDEICLQFAEPVPNDAYRAEIVGFDVENLSAYAPKQVRSMALAAKNKFLVIIRQI